MDLCCMEAHKTTTASALDCALKNLIELQDHLLKSPQQACEQAIKMIFCSSAWSCLAATSAVNQARPKLDLGLPAEATATSQNNHFIIAAVYAETKQRVFQISMPIHATKGKNAFCRNNSYCTLYAMQTRICLCVFDRSWDAIRLFWLRKKAGKESLRKKSFGVFRYWQQLKSTTVKYQLTIAFHRKPFFGYIQTCWSGKRLFAQVMCLSSTKLHVKYYLGKRARF